MGADRWCAHDDAAAHADAPADRPNLSALNAHLRGAKPEWQADREVGVWLKGDEKYNPEPDVTVIDTAFAIGQIYVERFYFVAEVLSESDKKAVLEAKLAYYKEHEHNRCVLFVRQDQIGAEQHDRQATALAPAHAAKPEASLTFPTSAPSAASAISTSTRRSIRSPRIDAGVRGLLEWRRRTATRGSSPWTSA